MSDVLTALRGKLDLLEADLAEIEVEHRRLDARRDDIQAKQRAFKLVLAELEEDAPAEEVAEPEVVESAQSSWMAPPELEERADRLLSLRKTLGLSQAALAAEIGGGVTQTVVSKIERCAIQGGLWEEALDAWMEKAGAGPTKEMACKECERTWRPLRPAAVKAGLCPDCMLRAQRQRFKERHASEAVVCPRCDEAVLATDAAFTKDGKPYAHRDCF